MEFVHETKKMKMCVLKSPLWAFLLCFPSCSVSEDPQLERITARPGKTITLPCQATNNVNISVVQWIRSDLERHILMKSDGYLNTTDQHESYKNRVQLKDDEMKNGDLSLVLKKVDYKDKGTYECQYKEDGGEHMKTADQIKLIVYLDVSVPQIPARPGDDVTLSCQAPNVTVATVEWTRPDLEKPVYMKSDRHVVTADQDPYFRNRVQLKDDEMKNGDLSLVLKKVDYYDRGTYVCRYKEEGGDDQRKLRSVVQLNVEGPGDGLFGLLQLVLLVLLVTLVSLVVVVVVVVVVFFRIHRGWSKNISLPVDVPQQLQENKTSQRKISADIKRKNSTETDLIKIKLRRK